MTKPKKVKARVVEKKMLNDKILFLKLENVEPDEVVFKAGQFISVEVGDGLYRSYSICSATSDVKHIELVAPVGHDGVGAKFLKGLSVGNEVTYIGPSGKFILVDPLPEEIVLLATGTGIAPFISYLYSLKDYAGKVRLYWGNRRAKDVFYEDLLQDIARSMNGFEYEIYLSSGDISKYKAGRITQVVSDLEGSAAAYYLCGHPAMVEEVSGLLLAEGVLESNIHFEKFTSAKGKKP